MRIIHPLNRTPNKIKQHKITKTTLPLIKIKTINLAPIPETKILKRTINPST